MFAEPSRPGSSWCPPAWSQGVSSLATVPPRRPRFCHLWWAAALPRPRTQVQDQFQWGRCMNSHSLTSISDGFMGSGNPGLRRHPIVARVLVRAHDSADVPPALPPSRHLRSSPSPLGAHTRRLNTDASTLAPLTSLPRNPENPPPDVGDPGPARGAHLQAGTLLGIRHVQQSCTPAPEFTVIAPACPSSSCTSQTNVPSCVANSMHSPVFLV